LKIPEAPDGQYRCPSCKSILEIPVVAQQSNQIDDQIAKLASWFTNSVKPLLVELNDPKVAELEADLAGLRSKAKACENDLEVCFLGMAGVGKSSLINALAFGKAMILPTGGVGPLTAQAISVRYGKTRKMEVEYYSGAELNQVIFALDPSIRSQGKSSDDETFRKRAASPFPLPSRTAPGVSWPSRHCPSRPRLIVRTRTVGTGGNPGARIECRKIVSPKRQRGRIIDNNGSPKRQRGRIIDNPTTEARSASEGACPPSLALRAPKKSPNFLDHPDDPRLRLMTKQTIRDSENCHE